MIDPRHTLRIVKSYRTLKEFQNFNFETNIDPIDLGLDSIQFHFEKSDGDLPHLFADKFQLDSRYYWAKQELKKVRNKIVHGQSSRRLHPVLLDPRLHFHIDCNVGDYNQLLIEVSEDHNLTLDELLDLIIFDLGGFLFETSESRTLNQYYDKLKYYYNILRACIKYFSISPIKTDKRKCIISNSPDHTYPNNDENPIVNPFYPVNSIKGVKQINNNDNEKFNRRVRKFDRKKQRSNFLRNISTINQISSAA